MSDTKNKIFIGEYKLIYYQYKIYVGDDNNVYMYYKHEREDKWSESIHIMTLEKAYEDVCRIPFLYSSKYINIITNYYESLLHFIPTPELLN